jgi:ribosomal-protein-alanine N-acetyltransferase
MDTARLLLRRLVRSDATDLLRTTGDPTVMQYWAPGPDKSENETEIRIAEINRHWRQRGFGDWAVIEKSGRQLIGFAGLHYIAGLPEVNVGYALERDKWGVGYGSEICRRLIAWGFDDLRLSDIVAVVDPRNVASIRVARSSGLTFWRAFRWSGGDRVAYRIRHVPRSN